MLWGEVSNTGREQASRTAPDWLDPAMTDRDDFDALLNSIPEPHLEP